MYCRKCGKSIPEDSAFCPYCGKPVDFDEPMIEKPSNNKCPEEKEHGYCSNCGAPLPPGKLAGVCSNCLEQIGYDPFPYGKCKKCGGPMGLDDTGGICEDCRQKEYKPKNLNGHIDIKTKPNYNYQNRKSHKGVIIVSVIIGFFALITIIAALDPASTSTNGAISSSYGDTSSTAVSSKALSVKQQKILNAFDNTIQGDAEGTIKDLLKYPDTAAFSFNTENLSVNNAIFTVAGSVSYTNAKNKPAKDNFTVKIIATDKVYYPLYIKLGSTVSQDITRGTNSLGITTSYGKSLFNKTEGNFIFDDSDGNIVLISDEVNEQMSLDEYSKIKTGMSYADVTETIGSYGNQEAHSEIEGYSSTIFSWIGNGPLGSNANVTFQNGRVIAKAQVGLQ